jgi:hypothetical protein
MATWIRRDNTITEIDDKKDKIETKEYPSINKAKKKSHKLQLAEDGALGRGSVVALKK